MICCSDIGAADLLFPMKKIPPNKLAWSNVQKLDIYKKPMRRYDRRR